MTPEKPSTAALLAIAALGALALAGGWIIVVGGGFFHAPSRQASAATFVHGAPAIAMAMIQYALATVAAAWLLQRRLRPAVAFAWAAALVFLPPGLYLLAHA